MRRYLFYIEHDYCYGVLRPVQDAIRRRGGETAWLPVGPEINTDFLHADERRFKHVSKAIEWNPFAVLVPGNEVPAFLPGLKIEVFHGLNSGKRRRNGAQYHFIIRGLFDLYCTHGPNTTGRFEELATKSGHFRVTQTGWSKLDPLFNGTCPREKADRPVILFASTFSPRLTAAPHVLETMKTMADKGRWKWLVNMHPKMPSEIVDSYRAIEGESLEFVESDDVIPLLTRADVMLCDTSSILSEFLVLHKPVVTFRTARPADYLIDVQQSDEIETPLQHAFSHPPTLMGHIRRYVEETHPYRDGKSSERTLDAIDDLAESGLQGLKRKPLNLHRHWKMRRLLDYHGFSMRA
jgi:CDP-glycerol glycerophosphotransferase (TagB/SpsB family)